MISCEHRAWLHATSTNDGKEVTLFNPGRMTRVVRELTNSETQRPSVLLFIGREAKNLALRKLFPQDDFSNSHHDGLATLRVGKARLHPGCPILLAESDPFAAIPSAANTYYCHETEPFRLKWAKAIPVDELYDILHARLFLLFTDVLCIFADDFADFESVVERLEKWAAAGSASNASKQIRPRVIIVKRIDEAGLSPTYDILAMQDLELSLNRKGLKNFYSSITMLHLADEQTSPLEELLWKNMNKIRQVRQINRCLYSAIHLAEFFRMAVTHTATSLLRPFDFVLASRQDNEVGSDHADHLTTFLRLGTQAELSWDVMAGYIASSILLDAYPPRMHRFSPKMVYEAIYYRSCLKSLLDLHKDRSMTDERAEEQAKEQARYLRKHLIDAFLNMTLSGKSAVHLHREKAGSVGIPWTQLKSNTACLWCLRRKPECPLSCGHSICETCVRIFGEEMPIMECQYHIGTCLLCHSGNCTVRLKPFPAGERILSIDGGGPRGVIPLEILKIIQDIMGSDTRLQDMFDIAFGTSVGGLIVCMLFLRGVPVAQCTQLFDTLTKKLFERPQGSRTLFKRLRLLFKGWYLDGHYDISALEDYLKENFGKSDRMFGHQQGILATKVGVVATTTIGKPDAVIFTNYNGSGRRKENCGYTHIRPKNIEDEACLWEAGRATSAAPVLYKPILIKASGPVQDGAMSGHNNPVNIALWENQQIAPSVPKPDIVISLGTGTERTSASSKATEIRHVVFDGYVPRLWRSYMSFFDGQKIWDELMNHVDEKDRERYIRLNVFLPKDPPALDNTDCMDELRESVHIPQSFQDCKRTLYALLVSAFYFELHSAFLQDGRYHCYGMIRCRLPGDAIVKLLTQFCSSSLAFTTNLQTLGYYEGNQNLCISCRRYHMTVEFFVRHPAEPMTIYFQSVTQGRRKISAFPRTIEWFTRQQHLKAHFGTAHHDNLRPRNCGMCDITGVRQSSALKRKINHAESLLYKKPRLEDCT